MKGEVETCSLYDAVFARWERSGRLGDEPSCPSCPNFRTRTTRKETKQDCGLHGTGAGPELGANDWVSSALTFDSRTPSLTRPPQGPHGPEYSSDGLSADESIHRAWRAVQPPVNRTLASLSPVPPRTYPVSVGGAFYRVFRAHCFLQTNLSPYAARAEFQRRASAPTGQAQNFGAQVSPS